MTNNKDYAGIFGNPICCIFAKLNKGDIFYRVHTKGSLLTRGRWLSEVKNEEDYAGIKSKVIDGVMMRTNTGKKIHYAVHLKKTGKWLPYVTGYNTKDKENGYAGILGEEIDGLRIYIE